MSTHDRQTTSASNPEFSRKYTLPDGTKITKQDELRMDKQKLEMEKQKVKREKLANAFYNYQSSLENLIRINEKTAAEARKSGNEKQAQRNEAIINRLRVKKSILREVNDEMERYIKADNRYPGEKYSMETFPVDKLAVIIEREILQKYLKKQIKEPNLVIHGSGLSGLKVIDFEMNVGKYLDIGEELYNDLMNLYRKIATE